MQQALHFELRVRRIGRSLRVILVLAVGSLVLSACSGGRDQKLAEGLAEAHAVADRAERAQKASESVLAQITEQSGSAAAASQQQSEPPDQGFADDDEEDVTSDDGPDDGPDVDPQPDVNLSEDSDYGQG